MLTDAFIVHKLKVWPNYARKFLDLCVYIFICLYFGELTGEVLPVSHERKDRMPPARCEPSLLHAFDERRNSWLSQLSISLDEMHTPNSFFLFCGRVAPIEFYYKGGTSSDYSPTLSDEVNNDAKCGNER